VSDKDATDSGASGTDVPIGEATSGTDVPIGEALPPSEHAQPAVTPSTFKGYMQAWWVGVRAGQFGSLPIIGGVVVIAVVFGLLNDTFFNAQNFTNVLLQMAVVATLAIGIVFVLLIAEIDLSIAFVAAVGAVVVTLLVRPGDPGWPAWAAILATVTITTAIGLLHSIIITKAGVPSFVVTLAGNLVWGGVVLILTTQFSTAGTIRIQDDVIIGIAGDFLSPTMGWAFGTFVVGSYAAVQLLTIRSRQARGLDVKPTLLVGLQILGLAVITFGGVWYANLDRGVPTVTVLLAFFLVLWSFVASRMPFGRHVYAVGGNPEAARRAGIDVDRIRMMVFMLNGFMAGVGGIVLASRLRSVATNTGGGSLLLNVIAAAVIGGTSLFGGSGRVVSALWGALIIASIQNGMNLLGLNQGNQAVITGLVLLAAVLIDSLSKRGRAARGVA
jgi:D-xylose transport system permease protein